MSPRGNPGTPLPPLRSAMGILLFFAAIALLSLFWRGVEMLTDWWWFQEVGYEKVFLTTFLTQLKVAALFGLVFFVVFYGNLFLANRLSSRGYWVDQDQLLQIPPWELGRQSLSRLILWPPFSSASLPPSADRLIGKISFNFLTPPLSRFPILCSPAISDSMFSILSTEALFMHLARALRPRRMLLAGLEPGVWADYPACTRLVDEISSIKLSSVASLPRRLSRHRT